MRVLVVDDSPLLFAVISPVLEKLCLTIPESAEAAEEAYGMIATAAKDGKPFDLVFSDWYMPEMSGVDLMKKCLKDPALKGTRFVIVSAEREKASIDSAMAAGAFDYIKKPLNEEEFAKKVSGILLRIMPQRTPDIG